MTELALSTVSQSNEGIVGELLCRFIDSLATTSGRRGSYHDSAQLTAEAEEALHNEVFNIDRGLYAAMLLLPGVRDHARRTGVVRLLGHPITGGSLLTPELEMWAITQNVNALPIHRKLKLLGAKSDSLKAAHINNRRARRLILQTVFGNRNLAFHAVKYRSAIESALRHAWGQRDSGIIKSILAKDITDWLPHEERFIRRKIFTMPR